MMVRSLTIRYRSPAFDPVNNTRNDTSVALLSAPGIAGESSCCGRQRDCPPSLPAVGYHIRSSLGGVDRVRSAAIARATVLRLIKQTILGEWCNGSTTGSEPVSLGSNPSSPVLDLTRRWACASVLRAFGGPRINPTPMDLTRRWACASVLQAFGGPRAIPAPGSPAHRSLPTGPIRDHTTRGPPRRPPGMLSA